MQQVSLEHLDRIENKTETVHARFVLGSDGAHSWVRRRLGINMEGDSTGAPTSQVPCFSNSVFSCNQSADSVWGVIDMVPDTDFPDVRAVSFVHSHVGALMLVPREHDQVRLYIQQQTANSAVIDPATGRVDKDRTSPDEILAQARKILSPYQLEVKNGKMPWWTVYIGTAPNHCRGVFPCS